MRLAHGTATAMLAGQPTNKQVLTAGSSQTVALASELLCMFVALVATAMLWAALALTLPKQCDVCR